MTLNKKISQNRLMRSSAAARYLGVSANKFRSLIHNGEIPVVWEQAGQPFLVDREDLDGWIMAHKTKHPSANKKTEPKKTPRLVQ